jgi:hypothetical protein
MLNNWQYSDSYTKVTASRVTGFPATTIGFTHQISYHITLEWGIQKSFFIRKDNYIGINGKTTNLVLVVYNQIHL